MRRFAAIAVCKLISLAGRFIGKGSSLPGKVALRICSNILKTLRLPENIISVTGSNGKTTTVELFVRILEACGKRVVWNREGANQIEGAATLLLREATLGGRVRADYIVLETDERYARHIFRHIKPTLFVVTNLYRDQLTRNGHPEYVYEAINDAVEPGMRLLLNADDPLSSLLSKKAGGALYFGVEPMPSGDGPTGVYDDGAFCPSCGARMSYSFRHFGHIGGYSCPVCGHTRPKPDYAAHACLEDGTIIINGETTVPLTFSSMFFVYNTLAAIAAAAASGVSPDEAAAALAGFIPQSGRIQTFEIDGRAGTLLTSKHENSVSYNQSLYYVAGLGRPAVVCVIVDAVSRKYFTSETSWLYDIDFDALSSENVKKIILSGKYACDLAVRFSFTDIEPGRIIVEPSLDGIIPALARCGEGDFYAITCFSDRDKLLSRVRAHREAAK